MTTRTQVDLRSDTVTRPGTAMRTAMSQARVGDDVWGDDPSVIALEARVAQLAGHAAALILPSGTQSNLVGLMAHCARGDEYLVGQTYHTYRHEAGGAAVLGGIQPQPLPVQSDGTLSLDEVRAAIKPDDIHFARSRVLSLENTQNGKIIPQDYIQAARALANEQGLQLHMDGARLFNAAVAQNLPLARLSEPFDSVSLCFSKGLGAPVGSVLTGSLDFIQRARRWRKMVGGGMRQAGILAAAMEFALDHQVERLAHDHQRARILADGLHHLPWAQSVECHTNMVFARLAPDVDPAALTQYMAEQGVIIHGGQTVRLVTHLDIDDSGLERALTAFQSWQCP